MPALAQPDGSTLITALVPSGGGAQLGDWSDDRIDDYVAAVPINVVLAGYTYAFDLLTAAGKNPATLSNSDWIIATTAMYFGIAYELLTLDRVSDTTISEERDGGIRNFAFQTSSFSYSDLAGEKWMELGITSKYKRNFTAGFGVETTARDNIGYIENSTLL